MGRKYLWGILALLVVAVLFLWFKNNDVFRDYSYNDTEMSGTTETPTPKAKTITKTKSTATPKASPVGISYEEALRIYADRRIQFNERCEANPASVTYKNGTAVMLDNRSSSVQTITLDGRAYSLAGYGYQIVTLSSNTLPHQIQVNCGKSVNIMQLLLQAKISR